MSHHLHYKKTDSSNPDFQALIALLDQSLAVVNGDKNDFYAQFNHIDAIRNVVVAYDGERPVGCGAFKPFGDGTVEIKRMFVQPDMRRRGVARGVLGQLEHWAAELGYHTCVLETGRMMPDAVALYQNAGYAEIPNYGQYVGVETSICMQKNLPQ